ncbi:hypothetical protein COCVIDRAFT_86728, partial [Bipolaris victoriae FI3]
DGPMEKRMSYVAFLNVLFFPTSCRCFFLVSPFSFHSRVDTSMMDLDGFVVPVKQTTADRYRNNPAGFVIDENTSCPCSCPPQKLTTLASPLICMIMSYMFI